MQRNLRFPSEEAFILKVFLLPEEDVPEKQPAWIHQQGDEREHQRSVQIVVQHSLRYDWQVQQPAVLEADRHLLQLLEEKDGEEERAGGAEGDQEESWQSSEGIKKKKSFTSGLKRAIEVWVQVLLG